MPYTLAGPNWKRKIADLFIGSFLSGPKEEIFSNLNKKILYE